ncbi:MAG: phosphoglucomutase/phosphomannomutase family protein [candidate division NC10 bacterium]|nr:phosphoglucomutase/phosphomannomutase family protein [candidate division NC10 bacterium]
MTDIRFGTDGWRGVIADDFTFANVRLAARAIARRVRAEAGGASPHVLVGYDTRFLSREFAQAAAQTMAAEGVRVSLAAAFAPTPAFSYAVVRLQAAGAVVITASHNPAEYSGVKCKAAYGGSAPVSFTRGVEEEIERIGAESRGPRAESKFEIRNSKFEIGTFDAREPWLDRLEELVPVAAIGRSGIRVVLDVMYGAGQGLLVERLRRAGCAVRELHGELNPGFGGLHPEPIPAYMGALVAATQEWRGPGPCVGFAFDGDSDRIAPVDEDGRVVTPHQVLALLVRHLVRNRRERGAVVKSVNIGRMVDLEAQALGVPLVVTPIGFKFVAAAMREQDALVGGEESGGFAVRGHIPERDPGLICLLLLECMAMTGKSLGTLVREMETEYGPHRYGRTDLRLATLADRDRVVARLTGAPPAALLSVPLLQMDTRDGVKLIRADQSWVMLRASGTEPLLRIYAEAPTEDEVRALLDWGQQLAAEKG